MLSEVSALLLFEISNHNKICIHTNIIFKATVIQYLLHYSIENLFLSLEITHFYIVWGSYIGYYALIWKNSLKTTHSLEVVKIHL